MLLPLAVVVVAVVPLPPLLLACIFFLRRLPNDDAVDDVTFSACPLSLDSDFDFVAFAFAFVFAFVIDLLANKSLRSFVTNVE